MKQSEVQIGKVYQVKVSGVLKPVRLDSYVPIGIILKRRPIQKFNGTVLTTGRKIRLTAGRMRKELHEEPTEQTEFIRKFIEETNKSMERIKEGEG